LNNHLNRLVVERVDPSILFSSLAHFYVVLFNVFINYELTKSIETNIQFWPLEENEWCRIRILDSYVLNLTVLEILIERPIGRYESAILTTPDAHKGENNQC